tara:strand:- start:389 stop:1432 length:1044 start_codon:yes stop_codon:yes gene_type:complete
MNFKIANIIVGKGRPAFIIAELGLSHEGSLGLATNLVDRAKQAGVDAVKFQMHIPKEESSKYEKFRKKFSHQDLTRYDYWDRTSFTLKQWRFLKKYCDRKKIIFLCSPFSIKAVDYLDKLSVPAWKIASGEFNNLIMLEKILKISKKPIILSTGLTYFKEIKEIIKVIKKYHNQIVLCQCTSEYPTSLRSNGLNLINYYKKQFNSLVGLSDHTGNINSLISAVALEANLIEAHVCIDKNYFGPDISSSITFEELKFLTKFNKEFNLIKNFKSKKFKLNNNQKKLRKTFGKSLVINKDLFKNHIIKVKDLKDMKPNIGISSFEYKKIVGKRLKLNLKEGQFLQRRHIK